MSNHGSAKVSNLHLDTDKKEELKQPSADSISNESGAAVAEMNPFSRVHSFRGKIRLFGHYFPAQFLLLTFLEYSAFACAPIFTLPLIEFELGLVDRPLMPLWPESLFLGMILTLSMASMGLYDSSQREDFRSVALRLLAAFSFGMMAILLVVSLVPGFRFDIIRVDLFLVVSLIYSAILRAYFYKYVDGNVLQRKIVVLGAGKRARSIERLRRKSDKRGFDLIGFFRGSSEGVVHVDPSHLIAIEEPIRDYCIRHGIDEIVIANDDRRGNLPLDDLLDCRMSGINVIEMLDFFERETEKIRLDLLRPSWLIYADGFKLNLLRSVLKRLFDIVMSSAILIFCAPFIGLTALAIFLEAGGKGPIFYTQQRVGRNGKTFKLLKFRSMRTDAEMDGVARWASEGDTRVTRVGSFIRKYRLDELPQIWNIFVNDMSLVGPRPERPEFVESLIEKNALYRERHRVTPGLAGWAQLRFPYGASEEDSIEKLQYDLYYVKNHGVLFDFYILVQTAEVVLFNKGVR